VGISFSVADNDACRAILVNVSKPPGVKSGKQRRSPKQIHEDLLESGFKGSCDRVAALARQWRGRLDDYQFGAQTNSYLARSFLSGSGSYQDRGQVLQ
jgi:hypothetical protein